MHERTRRVDPSYKLYTIITLTRTCGHIFQREHLSRHDFFILFNTRFIMRAVPHNHLSYSGLKEDHIRPGIGTINSKDQLDAKFFL